MNKSTMLNHSEGDTVVEQPVLRLAQVLDWGISLEKRTADLVRGVVSASISQYNETIESCINKQIEETGGSPKPPKEEFRWQSGIKSILDSKEYQFELLIAGDKIDLTLRVCVTVCEGHRRSKLHVRLLVDKPFPIEAVKLPCYREVMENLSRNILSAVREVYRSHVNQVLEFSEANFIKKASGEEIVKTALVFGANSNLAELEDLFGKAGRLRLSPDLLLKSSGKCDLLEFYKVIDHCESGNSKFGIFGTAEKKMLLRQREVDNETAVDFLAFQSEPDDKKGNAHELASRFVYDWSGGY